MKAQFWSSYMMPDLINKSLLAFRLMRDGRVPNWIKVVIPAFVLVYFLSPVDLIPDFILGLGQLDDLGVILLGMTLMARLAPSYVVDEHMRALGMKDAGSSASPGKDHEGTIEGEYRVVPPDR
jgi:uncharacterized membrane protein YkvA (DUF1232 family)